MNQLKYSRKSDLSRDIYSGLGKGGSENKSYRARGKERKRRYSSIFILKRETTSTKEKYCKKQKRW